MNLILRIAYFMLVYAVVSSVMFPLAYLTITDFPYPPEHLVVTRTTDVHFSAPRSGWVHVLFFKERSYPELPLRPPNFEVTVRREARSDRGSVDEEIPIRRLKYYFEDTIKGTEIYGYSFGRFWAQRGDVLQVVVESAFSGYDGMLVRTGFGPMFAAMATYAFLSIIVSLIITWLTYARAASQFGAPSGKVRTNSAAKQ